MEMLFLCFMKSSTKDGQGIMLKERPMVQSHDSAVHIGNTAVQACCTIFKFTVQAIRSFVSADHRLTMQWNLILFLLFLALFFWWKYHF